MPPVEARRGVMRARLAHGPNVIFWERSWDQTGTEGNGDDAEPERCLALSDHSRRWRAAGLGTAHEQCASQFDGKSVAVEHRLVPADHRFSVRHLGLSTAPIPDPRKYSGDAVVGTPRRSDRRVCGRSWPAFCWTSRRRNIWWPHDHSEYPD